MKTLRGSIFEESVPSATRHTTPRGLSPKRLLEFIMPELNLHCLRLASNSPKVRDTLLKLDEQGVSRTVAVDQKATFEPSDRGVWVHTFETRYEYAGITVL